jgi:ATP dependent DNA ligase domain
MRLLLSSIRVSQSSPSSRLGPGWAHELEHDGYRLKIHVRDGRVRLFTMNGADWSKRYPRIVEEAARIKASAVMDAEVVCLIKKGTLISRWGVFRLGAVFSAPLWCWERQCCETTGTVELIAS